VGKPRLDGAKVVAEIVAQKRGPKVTIFKYKSKTRMRRKRGHRQQQTSVNIKEIPAA
jgi:large subunit ribosomal protein L21